MAETGGVCLEAHGYVSGRAQLQVAGDSSGNHALHWPAINDQSRRTWADMSEAVEEGAAGIAILLTKQETGLVVSTRSRKGTGVDYWLGGEPDVLRDKTRLEVSGILRGELGDINARVRKKMEQTKSSDNSGLPVYVSVVEFSTPYVHWEKKRP